MALAVVGRAEDGYRLWLRYEPVAEGTLRQAYAHALEKITLEIPGGAESATVAAARAELARGVQGLVGVEPKISLARLSAPVRELGPEGFCLSFDEGEGVVIRANSATGVLYGTFALLRRFQTAQPLEGPDVCEVPRIRRRMVDHWDNLDGTVERGYAGASLWKWAELPGKVDPRYTDYARACASVGLNGVCVNNVNASARSLTPAYLTKLAALADVFRPYGIRIYLTARFSAPREIGGLSTADPLDPAVQAWWKAKADEIHRLIPDFGGFVVKANSEGQPGPQDYRRTHADGANLLAGALAPHGGVVLWRAFVYSHEVPDDRARQAYSEFTPLDGRFRKNVFVQVKNGPVDFMPREPFHPLFGAMPRTHLELEVQITQEYLGQSRQLAFLAPLWKETLDSDTFAAGEGSTVARVVDGSLDGHGDSAIAGVANVGDRRNWTGHPLAAANWYAFGRLAWDPAMTSEQIAEEWTRMTFSNEPAVVRTLCGMLLRSRETVVNYSMPLGLHHIMAAGHHFGPGPWVADQRRADWNSTYYHRAADDGLGFDRTAGGSKAVEQYRPQVAALFGDLRQCPENLLLWFHHVRWDHRMASGRTLWDELCLRYQSGVEDVRQWEREWKTLERHVDAERFGEIEALLRLQEQDACEWRDACLRYFQTFSKRPQPAGGESPSETLDDFIGR